MNAFNAAVESCAIQLFPILGDTSCAKRTLCWSVERAFCVSGLSVVSAVRSTHDTLDCCVCARERQQGPEAGASEFLFF